MRQNISLVVFSVLFSLLLIILLELCIRFLYPEINHQDTQLSLFQDGAFGDTVGWKKNGSGVSFGKIVDIDADGFRKMNSPSDYKESWVILGDSVTFGVGVASDETFVQQLQDKFASKKLWNTAVVGYSVYNYKDILDSFLAKRTDIKKVLLFFSLNDIYGSLNLRPKYTTIKEKTLSLLRRKSKLYLFLKNRFFDRSKSYALHDIGLYKEDNPQLRQSLNVIRDINEQLKDKGIDFAIIILPYEFQIRMKEERYLKPQQLLSTFFGKNNIQAIDAYSQSILHERESTEYYLYADSMHLSKLGHRVVFELTAKCLASQIVNLNKVEC